MPDVVVEVPEGTAESRRYQGLSPSIEGLRETRRSVGLGGPSVVGLLFVGAGEAGTFALVAQGRA